MSAAIRICYHAIRRCPYLSFMQAGLLLKPSCVFFRAVPELHQTQDSTDLPSELLRERGLTSCGACRPTPGHGTGTRLKASAVPLCPAIYTSNLLPTIYIAVYTYRCIYSYTDIRLHTLHLRCLFYIHLYLSFHFRFWFRPHFSSACSHLRLLFCKGIAGREHGKHRNASYWRKTFHDPPKS